MRAARKSSRDDIRKRSRTSKEQADHQGIGAPEAGYRLPVPGYAEDDHTSDLGVDEPVVEPAVQGSPPPPTPLPDGDQTT